jgi:hypothetical protein
MTKEIDDREELILLLRKTFSPSEETELLRQQLKTLKDYLMKTNFPLYLTVFSESMRRVEPKSSLVRTRGVEPPRACAHYHLKVACIPFHHVRFLVFSP